jgi:hypothetical protein
MGVPISEFGYTSATTVRGDHEVHKGHMVALEEDEVWHILNWATTAYFNIPLKLLRIDLPIASMPVPINEMYFNWIHRWYLTAVHTFGENLKISAC